MDVRIYLAGPGVFRTDALEHGERLKALCADFGFIGLYPLDKQVPPHITDAREQAAWIYQANLDLLDQADAVIADLNFFRGGEPDSGTSFEVGFAVARGKPVVAYLDGDGSYAERLHRQHPNLCGQPGFDCDGLHLEAFDLPMNLMLAVPAHVVTGGPHEALQRLSGLLSR
ncbi:nucleoside 2-deoxyribosyltransferase [Stutzerimonas stutzeri]|uniref:Nucleoside 2-deoxyribosyltransferase n=1 Tax=Stutzerimonas stutzeri TaxID=316 RepID=W8RCB4_STUST|nr:nucleoside 2-deoxyribosyltransferase [Stutzerimonas stutzeri]AHL76082.1 nucleoside 2-deoxyribosyltransferase [Stutzerimonas stutzeri]MCQ4330566.1 nucleoside 2-deoxyribosyltransferase [Stutzerimonas stutzeri]